MLTFHFTNIFILLPVYKNQCTCIYILITKLTCQFVENFPASFYSHFEQVFQCTEIKYTQIRVLKNGHLENLCNRLTNVIFIFLVKYTQILKNGQFGFRKFMQ